MSLPEAALAVTAMPYISADEHLADMLARHDLLLKRRIARSRAGKPVDLFVFPTISEEEVQYLLDGPQRKEPSPDLQIIEWMLVQLDKEIDARVTQSLIEGIELPLVELARRFGLSPAEIDLLVPCVAVELDRRYERIYGFLHDDMSRRFMSAGLAIELRSATLAERLRSRSMLDANAPLRYYRLIDIADEPTATLPWQSRTMRADERIVSFIAGDRAMDSRIVRHVTWLANDARAQRTIEPGERDDAVARLVHAANGADAADATKPFIYINGPKHSGADALVSAAANRLGERVLVLDMETLVDTSADVEGILFLTFRDALLEPATIYLKSLDRALEPPAGTHRMRALLRAIVDMGGVVFASGEHRWSWAVPPEPVALRVIPVQGDSVAAQLDAWRSVTGAQFSDPELYRLISLHPTPAAAVADVWRMAKASATDLASDTPSLAQLQAACREFAGAPHSTLARRLDAKHTLSDLVLPAAQLDQLAAICSQAKHSSIVYGAWGFDAKLSLGRGLNAMFTGQPGTGKTMAAEVIASELGVEILKIDLSQIVSKYIGETEKNLRELFEQAARANAILFFDEADALLGKRGDVKDAHDRYANTETAYLLQKMEEYPGITILATNLRQNMDAAFTRRMRFIVDFPFPEEADRLRIWESVWPREVPRGPDVDLQLLARQFRLAGGSIRNVAVAAAFLAAEQDQAVSMRHLMLATKRELQKMGRLVNEEEHRRYG